MRKLANTDMYNEIIQRIKNGNTDAKRELVDFTVFEFKEEFLNCLRNAKIKVEKQDLEGFMYPILWDYLNKAIIYENFSQYKACVLKAVDSRLTKYKKLRRNVKNDFAFDHTAEDIDKNILINEGFVDPDDYVLKKEMREIICGLIAELKPHMQTIILQYYGFDGDGQKTLEELGQKYNLTRERIRQIVEKGLKSIKQKIKIKKNDKNIQEYKDDFQI